MLCTVLCRDKDFVNLYISALKLRLYSKDCSLSTDISIRTRYKSIKKYCQLKDITYNVDLRKYVYKSRFYILMTIFESNDIKLIVIYKMKLHEYETLEKTSEVEAGNGPFPLNVFLLKKLKYVLLEFYYNNTINPNCDIFIKKIKL